jgi:hypothetical protein
MSVLHMCRGFSRGGVRSGVRVSSVQRRSTEIVFMILDALWRIVVHLWCIGALWCVVARGGTYDALCALHSGFAPPGEMQSVYLPLTSPMSSLRHAGLSLVCVFTKI